MRSKTIFGMSILVILISAYTVSLQVIDYSMASTYATTITAIIGAYAIWIQLNREADVKQAEFIMNYNNSFLSNEQLVEMEKKLELYRKTGKYEFTEEDRQPLINILVYLEAMAAMIFRDVMTLEAIDDLLSYRFFLIVNNPIVQDVELCPEADYYQGCIKLYMKWYNYKKKRNLPIVLEETSLHIKIKKLNLLRSKRKK
jgi:hypothetical protein